MSAFVTCRCKCHYIIIAIQWNFCQCFVKVWRVVVSVNSSVFLQLSVFYMGETFNFCMWINGLILQ